MISVWPMQAIPRKDTCFMMLYRFPVDRKPRLMKLATSASRIMTP